MKKKLLCLFLSMVMIASAMAAAGCSSTQTTDETVEATADTEESSRVSMTLTLWVPTDKNTTEEAIQQVEDAINKLTQAKYDTNIELHAVPSDDYESAVNDRMAEIAATIESEEAEAELKRQEAKELAAQGVETTAAADETAEGETTAAQEETYINEYGITVTKYPDVENTQMDIFLVRGYDNYLTYIENEQLQGLDSELTGSSKLLKTYIYPTFLDLAKVDGTTYAIPNNHPMGEYQYLLVNKALVDEYDYNPDDLSSILKCKDFIIDIGNQNLDGVVPLLGYTEAINMNYWSEDGSWSLIASQVTNNMSYSAKSAPKNVLAITSYTNTLIMMKQLEELGYVGDGTVSDNETFAVGVIKGDGTLAETYADDYYVYNYASPVASSDDIYGAMFAVSQYSKSLSRSMEIITYLNTDTEIRTILQYGVEDVNWAYNAENPDVIDVLNNDYIMELRETGNVYMTYPEAGVSMDYWNYGKQQNLDAITSPFMFFTKDMYYTDANASLYAALAVDSATIKARIDAMSAAELEETLPDIKAEVAALESVINMLDTEESTVSLGYLYTDFYDSNYATS